MPRPRRPLNGVEDIIPIRDRYLEELTRQPLGRRERRRLDASRAWTYPVPNGIYDPLTYLFLLDALTGIDPNIELRAKNLALWLTVHKPQFTWDAITVGKVLAELHDAFENVLGKGNGLLIGGRDYKGNYYLMQHTRSAALFAHDLRADLMRLAELEIGQRAMGVRPQRLISPLVECPSARGEWVAEAV